nr:hypothetical protein [Tanacetum cinerariifolium]
RAAMDTGIQRLLVYIQKAVPTDCSDCPICWKSFVLGKRSVAFPMLITFMWYRAAMDTGIQRLLVYIQKAVPTDCSDCPICWKSFVLGKRSVAFPMLITSMCISTSRNLRVQPPHSPYLMRMQSFLLPAHTDNQQPLNSSPSSSSSSGFGSTTINSPGRHSMLVEQGGGASDDNDDLPDSV